MTNYKTLDDFDIFAKSIFENLNCPSQTLLDAMKYSFFGGGKRIRASFVYTMGDVLDISYPNCHKIAFAIEAIHTYSLIHDDLPSMDNDDIRRGKPTCHIKYDESTAILAGDALHSLAFDVIQSVDTANINTLKKIISILANCCGTSGMVAGQQLDIEGECKELTLDQIETIHINKTAKMFTASILLPYYLSDNKDKTTESILEQMSLLIGLSFQIKDDILDVTKSTQQLGKTSDKDTESGKSTYVSLMTLDTAIEYLHVKKSDISKIVNKLASTNNKYYSLETLIDLVINRNH